MPIKHLIAPGIGFSPGSVQYIVKRGLTSAVVAAPPAFVPAPTVADFEETFLLPLAEQTGMKILSVVGCKNAYPSPMPPVTTWQGFHDIFQLTVPSRSQDFLEGWFLWRERIRNPILRAQSQYSQTWAMRISGVAWHEDFSRTRRYIQTKTEELLRTIERNKDFGMGTGSEVTNLQARLEFSGDSSEVGTGENWMWKTHLQFDLDVHRVEPDGLNVS